MRSTCLFLLSILNPAFVICLLVVVKTILNIHNKKKIIESVSDSLFCLIQALANRMVTHQPAMSLAEGCR